LVSELAPKLRNELDSSPRTAIWARRSLILFMAALVAAALVGEFGQKADTLRVTAPAATLEVQSPARLRGGLLFQVRFVVEARRAIARPTIVLDRGWLEEMTLNGTAPQPKTWTSSDGTVAMTFEPLRPGTRFVAYAYFQVNPTNVGVRRENVELRDGGATLARIHRTLTVFP
jgi:hypothetical protein